MADPAHFLTGATVGCSFPGCTQTALPVGKARVMFGADSICGIIARVLCTMHDVAANNRSVKTGWLLEALRAFIRDNAEQETADDFFAKFAKKQAHREPRSHSGNGRAAFNAPRFAA